MQASESGPVSFTAFVTLMLMQLMASQVAITEASLWQQMMESKGGIQVPITDIGQPWCRMKPLTQRVRRRGCETETVINNMCYGQCRSFYIPVRRNFFESCSFCTPINSTTKSVVLNCPSRTKKQIVKKVQIITACSCRVCGQKYI